MVEIDTEFLETHNPFARPAATGMVAKLARLLIWLGEHTPRRTEGMIIPDRPVIFATNHTHVLDFLPLWVELLERRHHMVGWVKARMYKRRRNRMMMRFLGSNVPLVSRGYLIAADFRNLFDRRPSDDEYRRLRDNVDGDRPLPQCEPYRRIETTPRNMLGRPFRPSSESYREAVSQLFFQMMTQTVERTRACVGAGYHVHIYPEGEVGHHLTEGHTGVVQAAMGLDIPIVPVGISGADRAFIGNWPLTAGGEFRLRFGEPMVVGRRITDNFRPFHPRDEHRFASELQADVDTLMARLNELVDDDYGYSAASFARRDGGVERFY